MKDSRSSRFLALAGFLAVVLVLYLGVLYDTQVNHYEEYLTKSTHSIAQVEKIEASRGIITDRKGRPLVSNSSVYDLTFDTSLLDSGEDVNEAILRLLELCRQEGKEWTDSLPISKEVPFTYTLDTLSDTQKSRFWTYLKSKDTYKELLTAYLLEHPELAENPESGEAAATDESLTQEELGAALLKKMPLSSLTEAFLHSVGITPARLMADLRKEMALSSSLSQSEGRLVLGIRYELALRRLNGYTSCVLVEDIDTSFISLITDGGFSGAKVTSSSVRQYETTYAAHILGIVGAISSKEEYEALGAGYSYDDYVGKSGVEAAFEEYLKGTDGRRVVSTNSEGKITGEYYEVEPEPGSTVELTIDLDLQQVVEDSLAETVTKMNAEDGRTDRGAAAVVEKVDTGEILAMASYPTYSLSTYQQDIAALSNVELSPGRPLTNRATQGIYAPGSTFKPLVAVTALEEGVVTPTETVYDTGTWYYPDIVEGTSRWGYNCWNRSGHGRVNVTRAITVSCNSFFYEIGYRLGIDKLVKWASDFGFGQSTGIEIGDSAGILASREEREAAGGVWYGGDTVMAAIGQSDNLFTPLQLVNYICTLVSGGERHTPHLLKTVKTHDSSEVVAVGDSTPVSTVAFSSSTLNAVKKGMYDLTTTGSLAPYFKDCAVSAGAKTGTAQLGENKKNNGVFVCFAPYDDPEIAVSIVIEKGGSGSALASTAVEILNAYFSADEIGTVILSENQLLQ